VVCGTVLATRFCNRPRAVAPFVSSKRGWYSGMGGGGSGGSGVYIKG